MGCCWGGGGVECQGNEETKVERSSAGRTVHLATDDRKYLPRKRAIRRFSQLARATDQHIADVIFRLDNVVDSMAACRLPD